ncbi:MAG TPA: hypothetical protein VGG10_18240 [Rhizomicrobium sp.]|jgi:hypothetical protein
MALKVFRTRIGFYDSVVATTSRPQALRLWGVRQDLFRNDAAEETKEPALVKAALAEPHTALYRLAGSKAAFAAHSPGKPAGKRT